jgi:hypothetical protein
MPKFKFDDFMLLTDGCKPDEAVPSDIIVRNSNADVAMYYDVVRLFAEIV